MDKRGSQADCFPVRIVSGQNWFASTYASITKVGGQQWFELRFQTKESRHDSPHTVVSELSSWDFTQQCQIFRSIRARTRDDLLGVR